MTLDLYTLCSEANKKALEKGRSILAGRRDEEVEKRRKAKQGAGASSSTEMEVCATHVDPPVSHAWEQSFIYQLSRSGGVGGGGMGRTLQATKNARCARASHGVGERMWWMAGTTRGGAGHLGLAHTETQRGRLWTA